MHSMLNYFLLYCVSIPNSFLEFIYTIPSTADSDGSRELITGRQVDEPTDEQAVILKVFCRL